jgi:hypothetical protein
VTGGWTEKSRELTGSALANSLYLDTMTFGNVPTGDILQAIRATPRSTATTAPST